MKKKILTLLLTLVMCFTVLLTVSGCEAANSRLEVKIGGTDKIMATQYIPEYKGEIDGSTELYNAINNAFGQIIHIKYFVKNATGEEVEEANFTTFAEFRTAGGTISNFDITQVGTGVVVFTYLGASAEVEYEITAAPTTP